MCGIAGIYYENQHRSISLDINKILKKIKHRGPDGKGFFVDRNKIKLETQDYLSKILVEMETNQYIQHAKDM